MFGSGRWSQPVGVGGGDDGLRRRECRPTCGPIVGRGLCGTRHREDAGSLMVLELGKDGRPAGWARRCRCVGLAVG